LPRLIGFFGLESLTIEGPISFPRKYKACPQITPALQVETSTYLPKSALDEIEHLPRLTIAASTEADQRKLTVGSWILNQKNKSVCTNVGPQDLKKMVIDCTKGTIDIYKTRFDSKDIDPSLIDVNTGSRVCYHYPESKVTTFVRSIRFENAAQCARTIQEFQQDETADSFGELYDSLRTGLVLDRHDVESGNF
jgi:hypothetical protein